MSERQVEELSFLQVRGEEIVDASDRPLRLRGVCLGGWLLMEDFMAGFAGVESRFRMTIREVLGEEKAHLFFKEFLDNFITEADIRYIASLGVNVVRVPFNYRHFEDDMNPFDYKPDGFHYLDKLVKWCRGSGLYLILDMHAAPGYQNYSEHSDNPCGYAHLWDEKLYMDRTVRLWREIARHYRDEPVIAGYDVLNEPSCNDPKVFNNLYRRLTEAIREVDPHHIIFLEGNYYSTFFDELEPPFDSNTVYSCHYYAPPALFSKGVYPGHVDKVWYDDAKLENDYMQRTAFMRKHHVPNWVGEFGAVYWGSRYDRYRLKVVDDKIRIFKRNKDHWTIWTYKDIGLMGLVYVKKDSEWMRRTQKGRLLIKKLGFSLPEIITSGFSQRFCRNMIRSLKRASPDNLPYEIFKWKFLTALSINLSELILPFYAEQFKGMSDNEIKDMMKSFRLENCIHREDLEQIIRRHCQESFG